MQEEFYYLNDTEKSLIQNFLDNTVLKEAVRKVILSGVYSDGTLKQGIPADPSKNFILGSMTIKERVLLPDAEFGSHLRSIINGIGLVESGFTQLEKLRKVNEVTETKKNPGR